MTKAHILVVEDEVIIRAALRRLLEKNSYTVTEAGSVEDALILIKQSTFELVISDVRLPGEPGTALISKVAPTPILLMTSYASLRSAVEAMKQGAAEYIAKPFDHDELLKLVEKLINSEHQHKKQASLSTPAFEGARSEIIGSSSVMKALMRRISKVAPTEGTILILGESGTGKELVAQAIHSQSKRSAGPLISLNCAAIPETLIESELFGHEKGSFTGAHAARKGLVESADGGTLFLDEIGELPLEAQARILRLLQEKEIRRVGSVATRVVDVRLIAATHRNLRERVRNGSFREDLFYRLNVLDLEIPALREREQDIAELTEYFLQLFSKRHQVDTRSLSKEAWAAVNRYSWPGNVRELQHAIERAVILSEQSEIALSLLGRDVLETIQKNPPNTNQIPPAKNPLDSFSNAPAFSNNANADSLPVENDTFLDPSEDLSLEDYFQRFVLENQDQMTETELAQTLGISRKCLWERRQKFNLPRKKVSKDGE
ncbi:MAG: sigma-54 dependent transcriptional regulator [Pseudomonadota bacterium]